MADQLPLDQIQVDQQNLYREESITDLRVATIRRLIPINADGTDDINRPTQYIGSTQIISQMG
ncbi:MAG: cytoplasmic protein, partial [Gemmatimonadota bacterium]|nr:cytoplasmic protein [Gemmatimonadota bacterium]